MRSRVFRTIAAILSIMLLTGVPTHAAPVAVSEVIQVLSNYQNPPDLRLRSVSLEVVDSAPGAPIAPASDSLLAGVAIGSDPQTIDVIAQGDVEGTVCDCGEITVPGGFPKWPLLFLAAIPFFFNKDCEDCDTPQPPSTPTPNPPPPPPPTPTPEPVSLLLMGTGLVALGAGMRRRYSRARLLAQLPATREEA